MNSRLSYGLYIIFHALSILSLMAIFYGLQLKDISLLTSLELVFLLVFPYYMLYSFYNDFKFKEITNVYQTSENLTDHESLLVRRNMLLSASLAIFSINMFIINTFISYNYDTSNYDTSMLLISSLLLMIALPYLKTIILLRLDHSSCTSG